MTPTLWLRWVHLLAASTWMGGLITLAVVVLALRKAGAEREMIQGAARYFARLSWAAMALAVITGLWQVQQLHLSWGYGRLHLKITLVTLTIATALAHQLSAKRSSARSRGLVQGLLLILSLGVFAAAVAL